MDSEPSTVTINLDNLKRLARGDEQKMYQYLDQFRVLVPERMEQLNKSLRSVDRNQIRQILHEMIPQLQFFEVTEALAPISLLVRDYQSMEWKELNELTENILHSLNEAYEEVEKMLDTDF